MVLTLSLSRSPWLRAVMEMGTTCASSARLRAVTTTFSSPVVWPSALAWVMGAVPAVSEEALAWAQAGPVEARLAVANRAASRRLDITFPEAILLGRQRF